MKYLFHDVWDFHMMKFHFYMTGSYITRIGII